MRPYVKAAAFLLLSFFFGSIVSAQVGDGSEWTGGGGDETVTVNVTQNSLSNDATVSYTDSNGTSGNATGTLGPGSSQANPNVSDAGQANTPTEYNPDGSVKNPGDTYKVDGGAVYRKKADGTWAKMKKKKKTGASRSGIEHLTAGDAAPHDGTLISPGLPSLPMLAGDIAPRDGYLFGPGEDVTSLPQ